MDLATILQILLKWDGSVSDNFSLANCSHKSSAEVCRGKDILSGLGSERMLGSFSNLTLLPPTEMGQFA